MRHSPGEFVAVVNQAPGTAEWVPIGGVPVSEPHLVAGARKDPARPTLSVEAAGICPCGTRAFPIRETRRFRTDPSLHRAVASSELVPLASGAVVLLAAGDHMPAAEERVGFAARGRRACRARAASTRSAGVSRARSTRAGTLSIPAIRRATAPGDGMAACLWSLLSAAAARKTERDVHGAHS